MLGYCPLPLYPNSKYMSVLNAFHSARRKISMKLQAHFPVHCDCSPTPLSSCLPPLPHAPLLSLSSPFLLPPLPCPPLSLHSPSLYLSYGLPPYCFLFLMPFPFFLTSPPPLLLFSSFFFLWNVLYFAFCFPLIT